MTDWYDDFIKEEKTDEEIVELTDIVDNEKDPSTQEDIIELTDIVGVEKSPLIQEDIIELTDIVEDQSAAPDLDSVMEEGFNSGENLELKDDIYFKEGLELEMNDPVDEVPVESIAVTESGMDLSVSQEQLETALERVIEKRFADKIDILLIEGMEKVIKKEINEIKERLQKDLDQMENF
ncbi:hypothetical protein [Desulfobacula sp.]|uniref:hypothetical protein n=1 Tax=Desulfobacula sp. TaxID=2593537 RepID=UPI0039B8AB32